MAEEKDDTSTDNEIDDGYEYIKEHKLFASSRKRGKQGGSKYEVTNLKVVKRNGNMDIIKKCIGQIMISFDGSNDYFYGTGTVYKLLNSKYCLIITCAHNLIQYDEAAQSKQRAKQLYYLPNGKQDEKKRLVCVDWIAHEKYNPNIPHCQYDLGIVLCYDGIKYYKKENININAIRINEYKKDILKNCHIFGYPVKTEGILMGNGGRARKVNNEWVYENMYTYPGESGSVIYKESEDEDTYTIYGIHIFGDIKKQYNFGVQLDNNKINWIKNTENKMLIKMKEDQKLRKNKKKFKDSEVKRFFESIGLGNRYKNFEDKGCDRMNDLKEMDHDDLRNEFLITSYGERKIILNGIKKYFAKDKSDEETQILQKQKTNFNYQSPPQQPQQQDNEMKKEEFEREISQKNKNEFHKKYISKKHILKNNIITVVVNLHGSSFCKKSISSGLYQYKFKIGNINQCMVIGIWKIQKNKTPPTDTVFTKGKYQGYGFDVYYGKLIKPEGGYTYSKQYGISCNNKRGTIIIMNINMNKYELSYTINDTDYGIAFKIEKAEYKVAVCIVNKRNSIELL